ncbi:hypothetical protein KO02_09390 [Sphingobacterium sp. ML3W]|uniref:hypothetical protein n=1 Tax=Sphingobacterium sp. ML3W TaxID=1538644 RepID=UPI0004F73F9C|nr:hypothetical protein [Sphingobacterium sp. ML3W]AIM36882.1 hypothetical protein KO02_09390 [Sphingobacterium sp. ML3W]
MYVPLTIEILKDLKSKGFNILKSDNSVDDVIQHFVPTKVNDLWEFMNEFKKESATVVIEQILDVPEEVLEGKFLRVF